MQRWSVTPRFLARAREWNNVKPCLVVSMTSSMSTTAGKKEKKKGSMDPKKAETQMLFEAVTAMKEAQW
jgi:hypothetical protein